MSILQQFQFEMVHKKAEDMQVPDALSSCENVKADVGGEGGGERERERLLT